MTESLYVHVHLYSILVISLNVVLQLTVRCSGVLYQKEGVGGWTRGKVELL